MSFTYVGRNLRKYRRLIQAVTRRGVSTPQGAAVLINEWQQNSIPVAKALLQEAIRLRHGPAIPHQNPLRQHICQRFIRVSDPRME